MYVPLQLHEIRSAVSPQAGSVVLFRRESDFFEALFSFTPPDGQEKEGVSDESPLALPVSDPVQVSVTSC